jgi:hypothetical protein
VIYATNAYTSHLLPQLTGPDGIVPVRGQIVAIRAKVGYTDEGWPESGESRGLSRSTWVANEGFEYWFPRPHPALNHPNASSLKVESRDEPNQPRKPLVIIGGGRETLKDQGYATYDADDSIIDPQVSTALKAFLSTIFPGQIPNGLHPAESNPDNMVDSKGIEIEWVSLAYHYTGGRIQKQPSQELWVLQSPTTHWLVNSASLEVFLDHLNLGWTCQGYGWNGGSWTISICGLHRTRHAPCIRLVRNGYSHIRTFR